MSSSLQIESGSTQLTQQDVYPGAQGPVKMIRNYKGTMTVNVSELLEVRFLWVDSVKVPIRRVMVGGVQAEGGTMLSPGDGQQITFNASRQFPSKRTPGLGQGALIPKEMLSPLSGVVLDGEARIEVFQGEKSSVISIGEITVIESIYAP